MMLPEGISIRPIQDDQDAARAADFISLHFGTYDPESKLRWISEKCLPRLLSGSAFGLLVYYDDRLVVGDSLMYVFPGKNAGEVKHFRIDYLFEHHGIGVSLWDQSEAAMASALCIAPGETGTLTLDTREENKPARDFFRSRGCREIGRAALYEPAFFEVLYEKTISPPLRDLY